MVKAASQGVAAGLQSRGAPPPQTKTASADDYSMKLASTCIAVGQTLTKKANEDANQGGGASPGVSRSISPTGKIETGHSNAKPGTGASSTTQTAPGASSATNLETSHSIGNGKTASEGPGALPESNASQPTGQPAGGKPADASMVSSSEKIKAMTQKQVNAPRERDTAGLISQGMNTGDTAAQNAFTHHGGAKTASTVPTPLRPGTLGDKLKGAGRAVKDLFTGSSDKIRKLEEATKTPGALSDSTKKNLLDPAKSEARKKQIGAIAGTGAAAIGAGAGIHHALKDKGSDKEASMAEDLSIKTASAEELLRKLQEQVSA